MIDAFGAEAHGSPVSRPAQQAAGVLPRGLSARFAEKAGTDRLPLDDAPHAYEVFQQPDTGAGRAS